MTYITNQIIIHAYVCMYLPLQGNVLSGIAQNRYYIQYFSIMSKYHYCTYSFSTQGPSSIIGNLQKLKNKFLYETNTSSQ